MHLFMAPTYSLIIDCSSSFSHYLLRQPQVKLIVNIDGGTEVRMGHNVNVVSYPPATLDYMNPAGTGKPSIFTKYGFLGLAGFIP